MPRWLIWSVAALLVVVAGVWGGVAWHGQATYGPRFAEQQPNLTVSAGDLFTLVVRDRGPSVGDKWTSSVADGAVAAQERSELIADSLRDRWFGAAPGGGGGDRLITFRAKATGTTTITLSNCYRGCRDEQTRAESRAVNWSVTVGR